MDEARRKATYLVFDVEAIGDGDLIARVKYPSENLSAAQDGIRGANIAEEVANLSKFQILNQTGISALSQANQSQQSVLKLLQ